MPEKDKEKKRNNYCDNEGSSGQGSSRDSVAQEVAKVEDGGERGVFEEELCMQDNYSNWDRDVAESSKGVDSVKLPSFGQMQKDINMKKIESAPACFNGLGVSPRSYSNVCLPFDAQVLNPHLLSNTEAWRFSCRRLIRQQEKTRLVKDTLKESYDSGRKDQSNAIYSPILHHSPQFSPILDSNNPNAFISSPLLLPSLPPSLPPPVEVVQCNSSFDDIKDFMVNHIEKKSETEEDEDSQCEKISKRKCASYICKLCEKKFKKISSFKTHFLIHSGKSLHLCPWKGCGKSFSVRSNMRRHFKIHEKEG